VTGFGVLRGTSKSGIGFAWNNRRVTLAMRLAQALARCRLALSVAMPVLAYIWRYNFEMKINARRARRFGVHAERFQIAGRL
jgi:hypothetical protein